MNTRSIHRAPALLQVFLHLVALTVCCVLLAPAARAQEQWPARVGRLVEIQGAVRLLDQAENEWISAVLNRPLTTGDHLVTETGSRAELRIGSTTVRLDGRTDLEIRQLDDQAIVLQLNAGSLALKVVSQELLSQVEVLTVEGRFRPRTVGHFRIDRRDDASEATSWRGELDFEGRDSTLQIPVGRRAELWLKGPAQVTHYNWSEVERDSFADWVAYDDTNAERSVTARYVSPEMTGWEDLDRYGNWQTHPEYGAIWIPTAVGVSWAPYRSGHWAWVAPWGWTWVDDARWGFAPFHYGRWVFWNRRWCWTPGPRVHRPPYAPALVGWVGGVEVGVSGHRAAPPVAWVPLGPRDVYRPRADWRDGFDRDGRDGRGDRGNDRQRQPISGQRAAPDALFTNQFVPGAVTAVAGDAFQHRRPVTPVPLPVTAISRQPIAPAAPPAAPPSVRRGGPGAVPSAGDGRGPAAAPLIPPAAPPGAAPARVPPTAGARGGPFNAGPNAVPAAPPAAVPMAPATATPAAPTSNVPHAPPNAVPARPESPAAVPVAPPNAVPTRPEPAARPEIGARPEVPTRRGDPGTRFDPGARQEGNPQREAQNPRGEPDARQERPRPTMPVPHAAPAAPAPVAPAVQPPPAPMPSHRAAPAPTPQPAPQAAPQPAPQPMPPPVPRPAPQPVPHAAPQPAPAPARAAPPAPPPAPAPAPAPRAAPPAPPPPAPAPPAGRKPDNERNPEQRQNPRQNER